MNPRALVTAIAATAVGFVLIISTAAGSGTLSSGASPAAVAIAADHPAGQALHRLAWRAPGSARVIQHRSWNEACDSTF